jgi:hypothetical protein
MTQISKKDYTDFKGGLQGFEKEMTQIPRRDCTDLKKG